MSFYERLFNGNLQKYADKPALECDNVSYTYYQLGRVEARLAEKLAATGIGKGDKVMLLHTDPCQYTLLLLAIIKLEAIPMPVYSKTGQAKLEVMINSYDVNYVITSAGNKLIRLEESGSKQIAERVKRFDICHRWPDAEECAISGESNNGSRKDDKLTVYRIYREKDPSLEFVKLILFTSGTTSTPKAIMLSEKNILANISSINAYLKPVPEDNILLIKDISHSSSITSELFIGLFNGCKIVMTAQLPITNVILKLMVRKAISIFFAVPTLLKGIMSYSKLTEYDLGRLRIINFYGSSMNYLDILRLIELFPDVNIFYSYGQTEASPRVTYIERENLLKRPASCGRTIENVKIHIEDGRGNIVEPGVRGEIVVTGNNVMLGYYKDPEKTKQTVIDGKLHTRDLGYLDKDGFLYITGRVDNMIVSAGKNIYPEEIEGILTSYEGVLEALCLSREKDNETCDLTAYVVLNEGCELDYEAMHQYCKKYLEFYKIPKDIIVVKELEKTPSGKIKRITPLIPGKRE